MQKRDRILFDIQVKTLIYSHPEKGVLINLSLHFYTRSMKKRVLVTFVSLAHE